MYQPLADKLRPQKIEDFIGQKHLLALDKPLGKVFSSQKPHSMIYWGPPGVGKTTLARLIAQASNLEMISISGVMDGVKEIRLAVETAKQTEKLYKQSTVLFVDEVHRFNKSQQDVFLPYIEQGLFIFIGATTENPSFELNNALLSRVRVYVFKALNQEDLQDLLNKALNVINLQIDLENRILLVDMVDGDARRLLNYLEQLSDFANQENDYKVGKDEILSITSQSFRKFDKKGEFFYNQISAMHKSVRGSNPDAALYWFMRMLDGGCDPLYLARRIIRIANEDIGNADLNAFTLAINAINTYERLGSPEGELAIAQALIYMASAPKSNAVYKAFNQAKEYVKEQKSYEVPMHLRNAPTRLMKDLGYAKNYKYAHDYDGAYVANENYFPDNISEKPNFYQPVNRGLEIKIKQKFEELKKIDGIDKNNKNQKTK